MNTTDAGSQARTTPHDQAPAQRLAELRATLLAGRGPGASNDEIAEHTRNRPWLGAAPPPVDRALAERQGERVRAGEPIVSRGRHRRQRPRSLRAALVGVVIALAVRVVAVRRARRRRPRRA